MGPTGATGANDPDRLLEQALGGDQEAWGALLTLYRERLRCMVALRIDPRLQGRLDPSDVLQDAFVTASLRLAEYGRDRAVPFYVWLRQLTGQQLAIVHRHHLGVKQRDARRELSLFVAAVPQASSAALAAQLLGREPRPSEAAIQAERALRVEEALERMEPLDRETLALRHFEQLTTREVAQVLGISEAAAGKRYVRALKKLKEVLKDLAGGREEEP
jgi:RNA polymerase sigma-70 factor (ECF subfamily)